MDKEGREMDGIWEGKANTQGLLKSYIKTEALYNIIWRFSPPQGPLLATDYKLKELVSSMEQGP